MNIKCQVFTPSNYVEKLIDGVGYNNNLLGKKLLENSCGGGNILIEVVRRYINDCRSNGLTNIKIKKGLEDDIVGFEIDKKQFQKCLNNLNNLLNREGIPSVKWQLYNEDFLHRNDYKLYDYVIGNPPYITYSEIAKKEQIFLNKNFKTCKKGKFDYCYAFIEKSISLLSSCGKMAYLVPNSIFKTVFGLSLRKTMLPYITEIQDYTQNNVFESVFVKSAIVIMEASNQKRVFSYNDCSSNRSEIIRKDDLGDKWIFNNVVHGKGRFGDYFRVSHVVATLLNEAFVLKDYIEDEFGNYKCGEYIIEHDIVRETATPKTLRTGKKEKIIFPYKYNDNGLDRYEENEVKTMFPGTYRYLQSYKGRLKKRACDKSVKWYEYGRSQALAWLNSEKCLISTVISSEVMVYRLSKDCIPYAGMYIIPRENNNKYCLDDALTILRSNKFKKYVISIGIHINGNSLRVTSKDIENYMF